MKMKKSLALAMATTLVVSSFAGCGSDEKKAANKDAAGSDKKTESEVKKDVAATFGESFEKGAAITKGSIDGKISVTLKGAGIKDSVAEYAELIGMTDDTLEAAITYGGVSDGENASCTVGVNVNDKIKADLLEMTAVDTNIYLNITKTVDSVLGIAEDIADVKAEDMKAQLGLPAGSYLKLTKENISELFAGTEYEAMLGAAASQTENAANDENAKKAQEFGEYVIKLVDEGIKKGDESAYQSKDGVHTLTVSKANINKIVSGLVTAVSDNSEEFVKKLDDVYTTVAGTSLGIDAETLKTNLAALKDYDVAALMGDLDFNVTISSSYIDGVWAFEMSADVSENDKAFKFNFTNTTKTDDSVKVEAPTDLISDEDTKSLLSQANALFKGSVAAEELK